MTGPSLRVRHTARDVVDTLGPGRRSVVWVQGCALHCPGCMVPEMWNPDVGGTSRDPRLLAAELLGDDPRADLTVSGGEPTEQAAAVGLLLDEAKRMGRTTWVYTGRTLEDLLAQDDPEVLTMLARVDVLVDGLFEQDMPTTAAFRGSANQRILHLTDAIPEESTAAMTGNRVTVSLDSDGGLVVIGVPPRGFFADFRSRLMQRGIEVAGDRTWD